MVGRFLHLIILATAAVLVAQPVAAQNAGDALQREMIGRFTGAVPGSQFSPRSDDPLVIVAKGGDMDGAVINLHRIAYYCEQADAEACETAKREFVRKLAVKAPDPTPDTLRIIVRDQGYFNYVTRESPTKDKLTPVFRSVGKGLYALLAFDMPEAIGLVSEEMLTDMELTAEDAWAQAVAQTRATLPPFPTAREVLAGPVGREGPAYIATMLIDLPAWERLAITAGPDMFVAITTDQFMVIGVMPDGAEFDGIKQVAAEQCRQAERCISPLLYRLRQGRWVAAD